MKLNGGALASARYLAGELDSIDRATDTRQRQIDKETAATNELTTANESLRAPIEVYYDELERLSKLHHMGLSEEKYNRGVINAAKALQATAKLEGKVAERIDVGQFREIEAGISVSGLQKGGGFTVNPIVNKMDDQMVIFNDMKVSLQTIANKNGLG
jgi:hypothetical protein